MVELSIEGANAVFEVQASHKLWALTSRLEVPLAHIKRVYRDPDPPMGLFDGWKVMGTDVSHVFRAGTFWMHGHRAFYDVRHPENTVVIELENEHYAELVVEVADPAAAVAMLQEHTRAVS